MRWMWLGLVAVAACHGGDAVLDARIEGYQIQATITIRGTASEVSGSARTPVAGLTVTVYSYAQIAPVGTATTDANGAFTLPVATNGQPLNVYLKASSASYADTYLYFATALFEDRSLVALDMLTPAAYAAIYTATGVAHTAGTGLVKVHVEDTTAYAVMFSSTPAEPVRYTLNGIPDPNATSTGGDGVGYVLSVPPGNVEVEAYGPNTNFQNGTVVKSYADALTMSAIPAAFGGD